MILTLRRWDENEEEVTECSVPLTEQERKWADNGNRQAFWRSRVSRGDPFSLTALGVVNNDPLGGQIANSRLQVSLFLYGPRPGPTLNQVGIQIMQAHVRAIDQFAPETGVLTANQFTQYHYDVFDSYGLPRNTFGGTPILGGGVYQTSISNFVAKHTIGQWYDPRCE